MSFNILEVILSVFFFALIVSVLFRQLKLSIVLGYLLVGALVGPHALGLVPNSEYINNLAEFGIVLLLFTVGLEFSISKLLSMKRIVFIVGGLQVFLSVAITTVVGVLIGMDILAALVIGSIVAMSSTALVIKQLNEQFDLQKPFGMNAVGILLFQDLAVIPLIILIAGLAKASEQNLAVILLWALVKGIFAIALIFVLGRWLLKPLFHFISKARAIELFTLTVLLVTLLAAWITHSLGLSYALGAFLAGIMLAETEFRHQIEVEIRPFRDVLLALFFITIGMLTDVTTWNETWFWILLLVFALVVGKMLLIFILCRLVGSYYSTSMRTGIVLAQGGEFGFALLTLALNDKILPPDYGQVVLAALLISIAISPILITFNNQIAKFLLPKSKDFTDTDAQQKIIKQAKKLNDHVIICGYGRMGQHIARLLDKINFPHISIDMDSELVQRACLAGDNVIYGDAGHPDILKAAGMSHAKVLVVSLSDHRAAVKIVSIIRQRYPTIPILVRCRDNTELKQFKNMGPTKPIAELFEASLTLSHHLLQTLQIPREKVNSLIQEVRNTDYELLSRVFTGTLSEEFGTDSPYQEQLAPIVITKGAYGIGKTLEELNLKDLNVEVMAIRRGEERFLKPQGKTQIKVHDIVVMFGALENLEMAERRLLEG